MENINKATEQSNEVKYDYQNNEIEKESTENKLKSEQNKKEEECIAIIDKTEQRQNVNLTIEAKAQQGDNELPLIPSSPLPSKIESESDVNIIVDEQSMIVDANLDLGSIKINLSDGLNAAELLESLEKSENNVVLSKMPGTTVEETHESPVIATNNSNSPKETELPVFDGLKNPVNKISNENKEKLPKLQTVFSADIQENPRFGRDYYINEAKRSTGARKKNPDFKFNSQNFRRSEDSDDSSQLTTPSLSAEILGDSAQTINAATTSPINHLKDYPNKPRIIENSTIEVNPFDELYKKAIKIEGEEQDIYFLPVDLNDKSNVEKLLKLTNGTLITDSLDQENRFSNLDNASVVRDIPENIMKQIKDDLNKNDNVTIQITEEKLKISDEKINSNNENPKNVLEKEDDFHIPSVRDLMKKFINEEDSKSKTIILKPKKITKENCDEDVLDSNNLKTNIDQTKNVNDNKIIPNNESSQVIMVQDIEIETDQVENSTNAINAKACDNNFKNSSEELNTDFIHSNKNNHAKITENVEINIPSVKDLAKVFMKQEPKKNFPLRRPRRVTREINEGEVVVVTNVETSKITEPLEEDQTQNEINIPNVESKEFNKPPKELNSKPESLSEGIDVKRKEDGEMNSTSVKDLMKKFMK